jgi:hypothetical protein
MLQDLSSMPDRCRDGNVTSRVHKIRNFVTAFTTSRFWTLSRARWIRFSLTDSITQRRICIIVPTVPGQECVVGTATRYGLDI